MSKIPLISGRSIEIRNDLDLELNYVLYGRGGMASASQARRVATPKPARSHASTSDPGRPPEKAKDAKTNSTTALSLNGSRKKKNSMHKRLPNVTEVSIYPDRFEVNSGGELVVFQFKDIVLWPRCAWIWKLAAKLGWRPFGMCVANRDWFHPNEEKNFEFYTEPRITIYMPKDSPEEYCLSHFRRIQDVMQAGGYHSNDLG